MGRLLSNHERYLKSKLTVKQQKFADKYIECGNGGESAMAAGYSKKTAPSIATENLKKPKVRAYIEERLKTISEGKISNQKEVMEFLTSCMRGEQVDTYTAGNKVYKDRISMKDRIKAAEQIGKRFGMWTDKVDNHVSGSIQLENIKQLSTDDLKKLANEKYKKFDYNDPKLND